MLTEKLFKPTDIVVCPHCKLDQELENEAGDYTYGGEKGFAVAAKEACVYCYKTFSAIRVGDMIKITADVE